MPATSTAPLPLWLSHQALEVGEMYKYVKVGAEFRFTLVHFCGKNHTELVLPGETVHSAGVIKVKSTTVIMVDSYSTTLKLGASATDLDEIAALLGKRAVSKWE